MKNAIFFTTDHDNWLILCDEDGNIFTDMDKAIEFVRLKFKHLNCGLSTHSQMLLGVVNWDNF